MFLNDYNAAANAAKGKVGLLSKNPLGYLVSSCMAGLYIAIGSIKLRTIYAELFDIIRRISDYRRPPLCTIVPHRTGK